MTDQIADDGAVPGLDEEAPKRRFGGKMLIIIAGGLVVLLLAIGAGLYFTGMLNRFIGHKEEVTEKAAPPKPTVFFDLPDLLVNLNSTGANRRANFLKISVSLEVESQADVARIQAVMPRVIDNFQVYLRELRVEDLRGSAGIYRLREELLARVNTAAAPAKILDVLFKEILIQ